ncbi:hypothetical protein [Bacillus cereus]|uniref:hypothetical protein n=1 Tax=Bacillus cereus TaxID=1396 RepID=UPI0013D812CF|nr:hypothetical protein [Bacillus cereus]
MDKNNFTDWLKNNTELSYYSIGSYTVAIDIVSSELENYGLNGVNNLYNVTETAIINKILNNPEFKKRIDKEN